MGRVDLACAAAGVDRTSHYNWLREYPDYAVAFESAREQVIGLMEDELIRRAYHGTMRPANVAGTLVMITEFSDRLMEFWLRSRARAIFGDVQALTGANGLPLIPERAVTDEAIAAYKASKLKSE